jgi:hypothetical protein
MEPFPKLDQTPPLQSIIPPTLPPNPKLFYESHDLAKIALQQSAKDQGFALVTRRSNAKRAELSCCLWPDPSRKGPSVTSEAKQREVNKIGTNCLFEIYISIRKGKNHPIRHEVVVKHGIHNHGPIPLNLLVILRQEERASKESRLLDYFAKGLKPMAISMLLEPEKSLLNLKDLQNLRARTRSIFLAGRTSIEAVVESLPGWIIQYELDGQRRPTRLMFLSRAGLEFVRIYPNLLWVDATYKTNR